MMDFISAAAPWVLSGIAVAAIMVGMDRKKHAKKMEERVAMGAGLGLFVSVLCYDCNLFEHVVLFAAGPLWGMALAVLLTREEEGKDKEDEDE